MYGLHWVCNGVIFGLSTICSKIDWDCVGVWKNVENIGLRPDRGNNALATTAGLRSKG